MKMVNSFTIGGEPAACPPSVTTVADRASETSYVSAAISGPSQDGSTTACRCGMLSFQAGRQAFVNASTPIRVTVASTAMRRPRLAFACLTRTLLLSRPHAP